MLKRLSDRAKQMIKADNKFYESIWVRRAHYCENCGRWLGHDLRKIYFSHILTKAAYPQHRHNPENINLLCGDCHSNWEFGDRSTMVILPKNKETIEKLRVIRNK